MVRGRAEVMHSHVEGLDRLKTTPRDKQSMLGFVHGLRLRHHEGPDTEK